MSRSDKSLPEQEIRALLLEDPPEKLSSAQRARLRARLGLVEELDLSEAPSLDLLAVPHDISVTQPVGAPSRNQPARLAVAAMVLIAGLFVLLIGNQSNDSVKIQVAGAEEAAFPTTEPTQEPPAATVCREHIGRFTAAIQTWDGINNWAFLTDTRLPEPDLVELALDSISAIEGITTFEGASETAQMLTELRADVATGTQAKDPFDWNAAEREAHRTAVVAALGEITSLIASEGWATYEGCG